MGWFLHKMIQFHYFRGNRCMFYNLRSGITDRKFRDALKLALLLRQFRDFKFNCTNGGAEGLLDQRIGAND